MMKFGNKVHNPVVWDMKVLPKYFYSHKTNLHKQQIRVLNVFFFNLSSTFVLKSQNIEILI